MEDEERRLMLMERLQKYVPFLKSMIAHLQNASNTQEKQRNPQLNKMMSLLALLTDQSKRLKVHTLEKCEDVLQKMYEKMESKVLNEKEDTIKPLTTESNTKDTKGSATSAPTNPITHKLSVIHSSAPASPSPPLFEARLSKPIIIPTERVLDESDFRSDRSQYVKNVSQNKGFSPAPEDSSNVLYTRRSSSASTKPSQRDNHDVTTAMLKSPIRGPSSSTTSPHKLGYYKADNTGSHEHRSSTTCNSPVESRKLSVFDRLGKKVVCSPETSSARSTLLKCASDKVPKSAALITNLTKQLKEAQMKQEIDSDIANCLAENYNSGSKSNTTSDKNSNSFDLLKKQENTCGIKKSTPVLKVIPARKVEDASVFGDVLSKIDKELIDKVNKMTKRKSPETKELKDDKNQTDIDKSISKSSISTKSISDILPLTPGNPKVIKDSFQQHVKRTIPDINRLSNKKPLESYERLSDKYPRKKISDTGSTENSPKPGNSSGSIYSPNNPIFVKNIDIEHQRSFKNQHQHFDKMPQMDDEKPKIVRIPDIKPNDPRIKNSNSPRSESTITSNFDSANTKNNSCSDPQNRYSFPSIIDMDYRYVPNPPYARARTLQPQTFSSNSSTNFAPRSYNNQSFQRAPLLPTPNLRNVSNTNDYTNQENFYGAAPCEYKNTVNYYDGTDSRISNIDYYDHSFNQRDHHAKYAANDPSAMNYGNQSTNPRYQDNNRPQYRGTYGRDNNSRWNTGRQDPRIARTADMTIQNDNEPSTSSRENNSSDLTRIVEPQKTSKAVDSIRTVPKEFKNTPHSKLKHNEKNSYQSPPRKNLHDPNTNTKDAIKGFKIPKIKRDPEPDNTATTVATNSKDTNSPENDSIVSTQIMSKPGEAGSVPTDNDNKKITDESDTNDEKVLLTKLLDMISEIYKDKKEKKDESEDQVNILQRLEEKIGSRKVDKIRKIINGDSDDNDDETKCKANESPILKKTRKRLKRIESDSSDDDAGDVSNIIENESKLVLNETENTEKKIVKPKRRNALEMLQHDVRDMFICEGVLTATGRRMCRVLKEDCSGDSAAIPNTEESLSISHRKSRKSFKKHHFLESKTDTNSAFEEENDTESTSASDKQLRIVLKKIESVDDSKKSKNVRGRNVARRGRFSSSIRNIKRKVLLESKDSETLKTGVSESNTEDEIIPPSKDKVDLEGELLQTETEDDNTKKEVASVSKKIKKKNLKKKIKRKGAWKMGILRNKRRLKKVVDSKIVEKTTDEISEHQSLEKSSTNKHPIEKTPFNIDKNYFVDGFEKYPCKLCSFTGKMITLHYVHNHPTHEVYSARLNPVDVLDIKNTLCENSQLEGDEVNDLSKFTYECRFCKVNISNEDATFLIEHLSLHTGEFRYKCNICEYVVVKVGSLKHHFKYRHKTSKIRLSPRILYEIPTTKPTEICGYICNYCNYTQIFKTSVESHIKDHHARKKISISKIALFKISKQLQDSGKINTRSENGSEAGKVDDSTILKDTTPVNDKKLLETSNVVTTNDSLNTTSADTDNVSQNLADKTAFLPENDADLSKVDVAFSDVLINNTSVVFEPFIKKMKITDALQYKINSMNENADNESTNDAMSDIGKKDVINTKEALCDISDRQADKFDIDIVDNDVVSNINVHKLETFEVLSIVEQNTDNSISSNSKPVEYEVDLFNADQRASDEQDSNDSGSYNSPQPSVNVNEVLNSIENNSMARGIMSNTIQRLASSLISSPTKTKIIHSDVVQESKSNKTLESILNDFSEVPPSEPLDYDFDVKYVMKMQIATIRVSLTAENKNIFLCFEKGCVFSSTSDSVFLEHVLSWHPKSRWNGFCNICNKHIEVPNENFDDGYNLGVCFGHILKHDSEKKTEEATITKPRGFLKMRRLSGDKLSTIKSPTRKDETLPKNDDSFLKITSVVSLSTDVKPKNETYSSDNLPPLYPFESSAPLKQELPDNPMIFDVKPWISNSNSVKYMAVEMLVDIFKCMSRVCNFTCNDNAGFEKHLLAHTEDNNFHMECCYCDKKFGSVIELCTHIECHSYCGFQCGHCFYRCFSKAQINQHVESYHKNIAKPNVILLDTAPEKMRQWELKNCKNSRISPYCCKFQDCQFKCRGRKFYKTHLESHNMPNYPCFMCNDIFKSPSDLLVHTEVHGFNTLQCGSCKFAGDNNKAMLIHLTDLHSEMPPITFIRTETMESDDKNDVLTFNFDVRNLVQNIVPMNPDCMIVDVTENHLPKTVGEDLENSKTLNRNTSIDSDNDTLIIDETVLNDFPDSNNQILSDPCETNDISIPKPKEELLSVNPAISLSAKINLIEASAENKLANLDPGQTNLLSTTRSCNKLDSISSKNQQQMLHSTPRNAIVNKPKINPDNIKITGVKNIDLFKCFKCDTSYENGLLFKQHLSSCVKGENFSCKICEKAFRHVSPYVEHLKTHGIVRYSCEFCSYRTARSTEVKLHVINKHKVSEIYLVPVDPLKNNADIDFFICTNKKPSETPCEIVMPKTTVANSNLYTPNDIDRLPRNSIYFKDVECALCPFKTKVRTNIIRHLQQHKSDNTVPEVCPVNPVPCLTTNEKYFNKMKNLACSSHIEKSDVINISETMKSENELPKFITESKRYVCGIVGCTYLTVNEDMLRHHYLALHAEETCYICPHCPNNLEKFTGAINIDKIISHLKLHDVRLYKCPYCNYHKSQKHIVERHVTDKHPLSLNQVVVVREDTNSPSKISKRESKSKSWACGLCNYTAYDKVEIVKHTSDEHGLKSQYKCSLCQYRCSYKNGFTNHFAARHTGCPVKIISVYKKIEPDADQINISQEQMTSIDTTPLWLKGNTGLRHIRGILLEEESVENVKQNLGKPRISPKRRKISATCTSESLNAGIGEVTLSKTKKKAQTVEPSKAFEASPERNEILITGKRSSSTKIDNKKDHTSGPPKKPKLFSYDLTELTEISIHKTSAKTKTNGVSSNAANDIICLVSSDDDEPSSILSNLPPLLNESTYGQPVDNKFCCSFCEVFSTTNEGEMFGHLCNELQYVKYSCKICYYVSWSLDQLKLQCGSTHPGVDASIEELKKNDEMESWIERAIQHQRNAIMNNSAKEKKAVEDHIKSSHSSKEVVLLKYPFNENDEKNDKGDGKSSGPDLCNKNLGTTLVSETNNKEVKEPKNIYLCYYCPKKGDSVSDIHNHWKVTHKDPKINSEGKVTKHALQFRYKIVSEEQYVKKFNTRTLFQCKYCGKKAALKTLQQHHKTCHPNLIENFAFCAGFKCCTCGYIASSEITMKAHGVKLHGKVSYLELSAATPEKNDLYKCNYCHSTFKNKTDIIKHHENLHSHRVLILDETVNKSSNDSKTASQLFKCPLCKVVFESYNDTCQHIETHIKPYSCNYCSDCFLFPRTVQLHISRVHPNCDAMNYSTLPNTKEKIQEAIAQISLTDKCFENLDNNDSKKIKLSEELSGEGYERSALKAVAKKSTTKLPRNMPTAKKSTSHRKIDFNQLYQSHYKKRVYYDNSNIHTVISLGGKPMRLTIKNLEAITNIHPILKLVDVKDQVSDEKDLSSKLG